MREFDLDLLKPYRAAVNCRTEKEAHEFLTYANSKGLMWISGDKIFKDRLYSYEHFKELTCFFLCEGESLAVGSLYYYQDDPSFEILTLEDLEIKSNPKNNFKE